MINPEDEILINLNASCTKDEAVAKLLGWKPGHIYPRFGDGIEHEMHLNHHFSLQCYLGKRRESAREELMNEAATDGNIHDAYQKVEGIDRLINRAGSYFIDIEDEIAKGETSALRIDKAASDKFGVPHLTLKSVDQWANRNYGISILGSIPSKPEESNSQNELGPLEFDDKGVILKPKDAKNLYLTFAFILDVLAEKNPKYQLGSAKGPNISAIAKSIEEVAKKAFGTEKHISFSAENTKIRIEYAMTIRREYLDK